MRIKKTDKAYKRIAEEGDLSVHVFCMRDMEGIRVVTRTQLKKLQAAKQA